VTSRYIPQRSFSESRAGLFRHGWRNTDIRGMEAAYVGCPAQRKTSCGDVDEELWSEPQDGEYA